MIALPATVFLLCFATSAICFALLLRAFLRSRAKLLLWSAACFGLLAVANALLFVDIIVLPDIDLTLLRYATTLAAIGTLLYGFIWDMDS
jgi:hypothetical protein